MTHRFGAALLVGLLLQDSGANSYLGKTPPELVSQKDQWLNTPDAITLEKLRGKVVWLEFGFLKCGPCKKMKPILIRWHKDFAEKGLVVIDIDDGTYDDFPEVKKDVGEKGDPIAVLWDKEGKNCLSYGIQGYPQAWLIGVDGKVVWEGAPNAKIEEIEKAMAGEFRKVKK